MYVLTNYFYGWERPRWFSIDISVIVSNLADYEMSL